jgi:hypothetical protein
MSSRQSMLVWLEIVATRHKTFGKFDKFDVGDLVSWTRMSDRKKLFGIIVNLCKKEAGGREIAEARVLCNENSSIESILTLNLRVVSKRKLINETLVDKVNEM